ncbi:MAG: hypothetical protein ACFHX7_07995 [Pseudomonadota bacterium]
MDHKSLKTRQRAERGEHPTNLALRVHRALSWLERAEGCDDNDGKFIFLWIAFNAAYAQEINVQERKVEQLAFEQFIRKLIGLDQKKLLGGLVWTEFPGSIRVLLDNPFVYQPFWDYQSGKINEESWKRRFASEKERAKQSIGKQDTVAVLVIVLYRLYTLRNQLIHGGATWNSQVNRDQIRDGTNFLAKLVPLIIELMLDNPGTLWGEAYYPVVDTE